MRARPGDSTIALQSLESFNIMPELHPGPIKSPSLEAKPRHQCASKCPGESVCKQVEKDA